ncbi:MAG TPA: hypothetical protein DCY32_00020, partial [Opitutae bacterium]|nr:hypothetical protein [Opitutae bacterium]
MLSESAFSSKNGNLHLVLRTCLHHLRYPVLLFWVLTARAESPKNLFFEEKIFPILDSHCIKCHGPEKQKGDLRLDLLSTDFLNDRGAAETWHDASDQIKLGEMPPE